MDVSFIIPARNEQDTLRYTVANLHKTVTTRSFEVIVVDDASDEDLSEHVEPSDEIVYLRNSRRLGVAKSRNIGARKAQGELLVFLDAHVCFAPGWLEAIYRQKDLLASGILAPATFVLEDFEPFRTLSRELRTPWSVRVMARPVFGRVYYGYSMTALPAPQTLANFHKRSSAAFTIPIAGSAAMCVTKDLFFGLGAFEDELDGFGGQEDAELCMRCWSFGHWVAVVPSIHCFHFKARRKHRIDYASRPFHLEYYEQSVENALRVFYLHLPDDDFRRVLDVYANHPGFHPDLSTVLTDHLRERKALAETRRVHDHHWLLRRLSRV